MGQDDGGDDQGLRIGIGLDQDNDDDDEDDEPLVDVAEMGDEKNGYESDVAAPAPASVPSPHASSARREASAR